MKLFIAECDIYMHVSNYMLATCYIVRDLVRMLMGLLYRAVQCSRL